jgi:hypothetical protein
MSEITARVSHSTPQDRDSPDAPSLSYLEQLGPVTMCRDAYGGTLAVRARGEVYLPRFPKEEDDAYRARLGTADFYNGFRSTVRGLTGMVFRKPVMLGEDVPEAIGGHWENIDLTGRHGDVFMRSVFRAKVKDGHTFMVIDWAGPEGARTRGEENQARPYWVHVTKEQAVRWRTEIRKGETVLTRFAYIESATEDDGEFGEQRIHRVREYRMVDGPRVEYRSWTKEEDGGEWQVEEAGRLLGPRMTRIPVVVDYADQTGTLESTPPLLDLALTNLRHYRIQSDRDNNMHVANVPIFVTTGMDEDPTVMSVGPAIGLSLPAGATAAYVETTGAALESTSKVLERTEQHMAALGLSNLVEKSRQSETAEARRMDKAEKDSNLAAMARGTEDAIEQCLEVHATWMGLPAGGTCEVNRDFGIEVLQPQMVAVLASQVGQTLSLDTFWDMLLQGNVLPENFDRELERGRLEAGGFDDLTDLPPREPAGGSQEAA